MTLSSTKAHLIQLLADTDNKVIALSGKWGTGKSHLWSDVSDESLDDGLKNALYVSLFGLSDMNQIKLKLMQSAFPIAETWEPLNVAKKVLEGVHKSFSALSDVALLAAPTIFKNNVIVLDDIERKHAKLSIDEVMGFIDEYTQQHGARFLLILNNDQLSDKTIWDKLREKVVDQEIRLDTTPAEAFEIAQKLRPSAYHARIKSTVETCRLTNIRIICKVIRTVDRILENHTELSDDILGRVIPSTVLLSAIHYKGIEDGPDFDFVLNIGSRQESDPGKKNTELDEAAKRRARWRLLLSELSINTCDEYEHLVVEYLESGLFEIAEVSKIIDRYIAEADTTRILHLVGQFRDHVNWHHNMTDEQLLAEARGLVDRTNFLDAYTITSLHELVAKLTGGAVVADLMVDKWIQAFQARPVEEFNGDNFWCSPLHTRIKEEFERTKALVQAKTTVFDACRHIVENSGWGHKEAAIMKSTSVKDFEATIKSLDPESLRFFMCHFLDMCLNWNNYETSFGSARDHFVEACRGICSESKSDRLAKLIRRIFKDAKLEGALDPSSTSPSGQVASAS